MATMEIKRHLPPSKTRGTGRADCGGPLYPRDLNAAAPRAIARAQPAFHRRC